MHENERDYKYHTDVCAVDVSVVYLCRKLYINKKFNSRGHVRTNFCIFVFPLEQLEIIQGAMNAMKY